MAIFIQLGTSTILFPSIREINLPTTSWTGDYLAMVPSSISFLKFDRNMSTSPKDYSSLFLSWCQRSQTELKSISRTFWSNLTQYVNWVMYLFLQWSRAYRWFKYFIGLIFWSSVLTISWKRFSAYLYITVFVQLDIFNSPHHLLI